jgi:hypothetical protein
VILNHTGLNTVLGCSSPKMDNQRMYASVTSETLNSSSIIKKRDLLRAKCQDKCAYCFMSFVEKLALCLTAGVAQAGVLASRQERDNLLTW